ncbi:MAG: glutamate-5-semialdehyde dehydrogenase [Clostridiales bacterium]|nr:glutamate-5-semialdehyde dehydrogenase [Clostridiales bacterium]
MNAIEAAARAKTDSRVLATLSIETRNGALVKIADALMSHSVEIAEANEKDLKAAQADGLPDPIVKRLAFDGKKIEDAVAGLRDMIGLADPVGRIMLRRELDADLLMEQVTCPIGVIGVIFESRPDALVQIAALCLKSGNAAILKGGSEAANTNRTLYEIIHGTGVEAGLPQGFLTLLESRSEINELLACHESVDLIIPRGSNEFVRYIMDYSEIPVMGHADGICHVYVDKAADIAKAVPIVRDSKTQYVAVCNAVETVLVHKDIAAALMPPLMEALTDKGVEVRGCERTFATHSGIKPAIEDDYKTEYLDYIVTVKVVDDIAEAIGHINAYGSHHTDAIITEDDVAAAIFMAGVDSAGVYHNCSTRFADGFRYGFGAEVGVSTGKLHARGPVGLDGLVTYKYLLHGNGNLVGDYAEGRKSFRFKDL